MQNQPISGSSANHLSAKRAFLKIIQRRKEIVQNQPIDGSSTDYDWIKAELRDIKPENLKTITMNPT